MALRSEVAALVVVGAFGISIGLVYAFFLPTFFPGYKTAWILNLGIFAAMLIGGYIGYRVPTADTLSLKVKLSFCYGAVVAMLVSFLSQFIILNIRGS